MSTDLVHSDIRAILEALGLGTHARAYSMHAVVQGEILPAIRALRRVHAVLSPDRESCDACGAEPGEGCRFGCLGYAIEHGDLTEPCS